MTHSNNEGLRRWTAFGALMLTALAGSLLFASASTKQDSESSTFLRSNEAQAEQSGVRRRLTVLLQYTDPKSVTIRPQSSLDIVGVPIEDRSVKSNVLLSSIDRKLNPPPPSKTTKDLYLQHTAETKRRQLSVKKYTLENALSIFEYYDASAGLFVYDPKEDSFNVVYPDGMIWEELRFKRIRQYLFNSLRLLFPERFTPESPEFVLPISSMDYPQVRYGDLECFKNATSVDCVPEDFPPIMHFGSVFLLPKIPSIIPMPMPQWDHLGCMNHWAKNHAVPRSYMERRYDDNNPIGLVFGETAGVGWDDLIPQVVWRATDRGFLNRIYKYLERPNLEKDIGPKLTPSMSEQEKKNAAIKALWDVYDSLLPRWKAVVWTAEAEREAEEKGDDSLPWCNIKYSRTFDGEDDYYDKIVNYGIPAVGERMELETLVKYKYHMDIGGGGGTTWMGTFEKLAMPGVLFHHVTPTKDYNHALIQPWVHYIPLDEDLKDLKKKYEWAESHPEEARKISERATALIRSLGTEDGFGDFFNEFYREPLRQVVEAYEPLSGNDGNAPWQDIVRASSDARIMIKCKGEKAGNCDNMDEEEAKRRSSNLKTQIAYPGSLIQS